MRLCAFSVILSIAHLAVSSPVPVTVNRGQSNEVSQDATPGTITVFRPSSRYPSSSKADLPRIPGHVDPSILPPLTKHRNSKGVSPIPDRKADRDGPIDALLDLDDQELFDLENNESLSSFAYPGMPPDQRGNAEDDNDMNFIMLAFGFLVVVTVMETWGSYRRRQGTIRLEETDEKRRLP